MSKKKVKGEKSNLNVSDKKEKKNLNMDDEKNEAEINNENTPVLENENQEPESNHDKSEDIESKNIELQKEVNDLKEKLLRKQADYENFRKRLYREKDDSIKYSNQMMLMDIVEIIDDFERAIKSADDSKDFNSFHNGIEMIEKQFTSMLEKKWGLTRFSSVGEEFDPEKHQAISMEERKDHDKSMVIEDYQKGYFFYDRVLRPAKVKVSQPVVLKDDDKDNKENN